MSRSEGGPPKNPRAGKPRLQVVKEDAPPPPARVLPHDEPAERRLTGLFIMSGSQFAGQIPPAPDFFHPVCGNLIAACHGLVAEGRSMFTLDEVTSRADSLRPGMLAKYQSQRGSETFLADVLSEAQTVTAALDSMRVRSLAQLRRHLEMCEETAREIRDRGTEDPRGVLEDTLRAFRDADSTMADARRAIVRGSDVELARALLEMMRRGGERITYDLGSFYRYIPERGLWKRVDLSEVRQVVASLDGMQISRERTLDMTSAKVSGAVRLAEDLAARPNYFSADEDGQNGPPSGLCFQNGFVRVTGEGVTLQPHAAGNRQTAGLPYLYDPTVKPLRFERFLDEVFRDDADRAEKILALQEFVGIALLGLAPVYQKAVVFTGGGGDGKGVLIDVLFELFPAATRAAIPPQELTSEYARAALSIALLNAVSEMPGKEIIASEPLKAAITGDLMQGRYPAGRMFYFRPRAAQLFSANNLPSTADQSRAFWRRFIVLEFNRSFEDDPQRDPELRPKLFAEAGAIASWALQGAVRLLKRGVYTIPSSASAALARWRKNTDQVQQFVDDVCRPTDRPVTKSSLLYKTYLAWCAKAGHKFPLNRNRFVERMDDIGKRAGFRRHDLHEGSFWSLDVEDPE